MRYPLVNNKVLIHKIAPVFSAVFILVAIASSFAPRPVLAAISDEVQSQAFVLMVGETGQVLLEKNMDEPRKPASTTKVMTTLLALEKGDLTDEVTVSKSAYDAVPRDGSCIGLVPGETLTLDDMLYAVMLESANEASNAVAEYISGTMEDFALLMTERAAELGAKNTNFANANGLNHDDHYTTPYDLALITKKAIENQDFLRIWGSYQYILEPTNLQKDKRILNNKNRLLSQGSIPYEGILGGKTGYTVASQNTLVEAAHRDGLTLIAVVFQAPNAVATFQDAIKLLNYGFNNFLPVTFEDEEYSSSYTYYLHKNLDPGQVVASYGLPEENLDGSNTVDINFSLSDEATAANQLMFGQIASISMTSPPAPPAPTVPASFFVGGIKSLSESLPFLTWLTALLSLPFALVKKVFALTNLLPIVLAYIAKALLVIFGLLFALACFFRTRRYFRRRKRLIAKQRQEEKRRAYRQQQSFWS